MSNIVIEVSTEPQLSVQEYKQVIVFYNQKHVWAEAVTNNNAIEQGKSAYSLGEFID